MNDTAADRARRAGIRRQKMAAAVLSRTDAEELDRAQPIPVHERLNAVWQLSLVAWEFAGQPVQPLRRDVFKVLTRSEWEAE